MRFIRGILRQILAFAFKFFIKKLVEFGREPLFTSVDVLFVKSLRMTLVEGVKTLDRGFRPGILSRNDRGNC